MPVDPGYCVASLSCISNPSANPNLLVAQPVVHPGDSAIDVALQTHLTAGSALGTAGRRHPVWCPGCTISRRGYNLALAGHLYSGECRPLFESLWEGDSHRSCDRCGHHHGASGRLWTAFSSKQKANKKPGKLFCYCSAWLHLSRQHAQRQRVEWHHHISVACLWKQRLLGSCVAECHSR